MQLQIYSLIFLDTWIQLFSAKELKFCVCSTFQDKFFLETLYHICQRHSYYLNVVYRKIILHQLYLILSCGGKLLGGNSRQFNRLCKCYFQLFAGIPITLCNIDRIEILKRLTNISFLFLLVAILNIMLWNVYLFKIIFVLHLLLFSPVTRNSILNLFSKHYIQST